MDWFVKLIYFTLLICGSSAQNWDPPFVTQPENDHVTITENGGIFNVRMDENQDNLEVAILEYKGQPADIKLESSNNLHTQMGLVAECSGANCVLVAKIKMDFEQGAFNVRLSVTIKTVSKELFIDLINIDDNPTRMQLNSEGGCRVDEDYVGVTQCKYKLDDEDGFLVKPTLEVPVDHKDLFEFKLDDPNVPVTAKTTTATLYFLKKLEYDTSSLYIFSLSISAGTPSENTFRVLIEIIDIPNKVPIWSNIKSLYQIDEHSNQEIEITAKDGDLTIQADISYKITEIDQQWETYIIIENEQIGKIKVSDIERDQQYFDENTGISLKVVAFENDDHSSATEPYEITIIINDIDDEDPVITLTGSPFKICENKNTPIPNLILSVNDKDVGENARYNVELDKANEFSKAFRLVPESGYQEVFFLLTIDDVELLDYENANARDISIKITSKSVNGVNSDTKDIAFKLINWNDELPEFDKASYIESVDENIAANHLITKVLATDKDGFDISYSLPDGMRTILDINSDGEITTKVDNAFDYERQQTLLLYVTATDQFQGDEEGCNPLGTSNPPNSVTVVVTINVNDLNDETPILTAIISKDILIMENQIDGTTIDLTPNLIEATDADKDSVLDFEIDWTNSRATKYGSRLTDDEFEEHVTGFLSVNTEQSSGKAVPIFKTVDKYPEKLGESPDYEKFDNVVLRLKVTDTDQTLPNNFATAEITIFIGDENDNEPVFQSTSLKEGKVIENAVNGVPIGRVLAIDQDGIENNVVVYKLEETGNTQQGVVKIDPNNGDIIVFNDGPDTNINCDPDIDSLTYVVTATDPKGLYATDNIKIDIQDVNDNPPVLEQLTVQKIKEKLPSGTEIATAVATDEDRDPPNNEIKYTINNAEASTHFKIDDKSGIISINNPINGDTLSVNPILVNIMATDNNGFGSNDQITISIEIVDINDNSPVIQTQTLTANEDTKPGSANEDIGQITITDDDEAGNVNSQVELDILKVVYKDVEIFDYFKVSPPIQAANTKVSTSTLTVLKPLKGFPGIITIELKATDKGPQNEGSVPAISNIALAVELYNFISPTFEFPSKPQQRFLLISGEAGFPIEHFNGKPFDSITAVDSQSKYIVELKVLDPATELDHDIVMFNTGTSTSSSPGTLVFKSAPTKDEYNVRFEAINRDGIPQLPATTIDVTFIFKDRNSEPEFTDNEAKDISIKENDKDATINNLPKASYGEGTENPAVYYHIENPSPTMPFILAENTDNILTINTDAYPDGLDRDIPGGEKHLIRIIATRFSEPPMSPGDKSILNVYIDVEDINDNKPEFQGTPYYKALLNTLAIGGSVATVEATDADATDVIKIEITDSEGFEGVENIKNPFTLTQSGTKAEIKLDFTVTASMSGYFNVELTVTDSLGGISNPIKTNALIYVVSDLHRMDFKFLNTVKQIEDLMPEILEILEKVFKYECVFEKIKEEAENNENLAVASVYFIDISKNQPILKETIIEIASVVTVISQLTGEFNKIGLTLRSFVDNLIFPEDLSEYYKTWLIGVAVVMGVLIGFMIIAFSFKYIGMRKQITRLTDKKFGSMDSGLNRIVAPNTNNYTHDGANPVFCYEQKAEMPDRTSVSSGDSALYGVENNPVFTNNFEKQTSPTPSEI